MVWFFGVISLLGFAGLALHVVAVNKKRREAESDKDHANEMRIDEAKRKEKALAEIQTLKVEIHQLAIIKNQHQDFLRRLTRLIREAPGE